MEVEFPECCRIETCTPFDYVLFRHVNILVGEFKEDANFDIHCLGAGLHEKPADVSKIKLVMSGDETPVPNHGFP